MPVWILDGEHELLGRRDLAHDWFAQLSALAKDRSWTPLRWIALLPLDRLLVARHRRTRKSDT